MNVLITSLGSNTTISVIKALRKQDVIKTSITGTDSNPEAFCAGARMVEHFQQLPSVLDDPNGYKAAMISLIEKHSIECVMPIHDLEIQEIAKISAELPDLTFWAVNSADIVTMCNNKSLMNTEAEKIQIVVPKTYAPNEVHAESFPLILKPLAGVSSKNVSIAYNLRDFNFLIDSYKDDVLIQEYIEGEEFTIDCYSSYSGKYYGCVVRKRIETKAGITVKGEVVKHPQIESLCERILNSIQYKGASNVQFIVNGDTPHFIEINPRFSGAGILSYEAGLNSPLLTLMEANGQNLPDFHSLNLKIGLKMCRYWQETFHE